LTDSSHDWACATFTGKVHRWTDKLGDLPGEMMVTVRLKKLSIGTEVNIVQEGLPDAIPPDACTLGWQESLTLRVTNSTNQKVRVGTRG
jgi:hypothetical protein